MWGKDRHSIYTIACSCGNSGTTFALINFWKGFISLSYLSLHLIWYWVLWIEMLRNSEGVRLEVVWIFVFGWGFRGVQKMKKTSCLMLCSWWCCYGVTFLLFWLTRVVCHRIGDPLSMKKGRKATRWIQWSLVFCIPSNQVKGYGIVENAISWNHLAAIIVLFVSSCTCWSLRIFLLNNRRIFCCRLLGCVIYIFAWNFFLFQVGDVCWRWTITACGSSIVLEHWITSTSFCFWYVFSYFELKMFFYIFCHLVSVFPSLTY